jgi:acetate kinase
VVFTGGIGENSAAIRGACCRGLEWLGIELDAAANEAGAGDRLVSQGPVRVLSLATNEEIIVARRAWRVLSGLV